MEPTNCFDSSFNVVTYDELSGKQRHNVDSFIKTIADQFKRVCTYGTESYWYAHDTWCNSVRYAREKLRFAFVNDCVIVGIPDLSHIYGNIRYYCITPNYYVKMLGSSQGFVCYFHRGIPTIGLVEGYRYYNKNPLGDKLSLTKELLYLIDKSINEGISKIKEIRDMHGYFCESRVGV